MHKRRSTGAAGCTPGGNAQARRGVGPRPLTPPLHAKRIAAARTKNGVNEYTLLPRPHGKPHYTHALLERLLKPPRSLCALPVLLRPSPAAGRQHPGAQF